MLLLFACPLHFLSLIFILFSLYFIWYFLAFSQSPLCWEEGETLCSTSLAEESLPFEGELGMLHVPFKKKGMNERLWREGWSEELFFIVSLI